MKSYTDIEQSRKLVEILPLESADMHYNDWNNDFFCVGYKHTGEYIADLGVPTIICGKLEIPYLSLAALLKYLTGISPQVYTPILFPSEGKWILQFTEYDHGVVCEVSCDNPVDACYELILKRKML